MEKFKLISMTDFVIHESFGVGNEIINKEVFYNKCSNYANFLKQPLKLEMFVSDDKEKVLFEDFIYVKDWYRIEHKHNTLNRNCRQLSYIEKLKTVEDVLEFNEVILTQNATKQFL